MFCLLKTENAENTIGLSLYGQVSNSLTQVSNNHTLGGCQEINKVLRISGIKVWHGICYVISENECVTHRHCVMFLILMEKQGSFVAKRGFLLLKEQEVITIKNIYYYEENIHDDA